MHVFIGQLRLPALRTGGVVPAELPSPAPVSRRMMSEPTDGTRNGEVGSGPLPRTIDELRDRIEILMDEIDISLGLNPHRFHRRRGTILIL